MATFIRVPIWWRVWITPAYDLLSTLPYPRHEKRMALRLDGKDDDFRAADIAKFGKQFDVPEAATRRMIDALRSRAETWLGKLEEIGFEPGVTEMLRSEIAARIARLRRMV